MDSRERIVELKRLLRYVKPYRLRLAAGASALAVVGVGEGVIALMIRPLFDRILNPDAADPRLPLVTIGSHTVYLNSFVPSSIQWGWSVFSLVLFTIFLVKAAAEYMGTVEIQYVGQAGVTDLRNDIYEKVVRQPIGFFQKQQTGRLMSAVISDVERVRGMLSESLALFFRLLFTLFSLVLVLVVIDWKMALGSAVFIPMIILPIRKLGRRIRRSVETSQTRLGELSQILQETFSGNRVVKAFGMERFEIDRFRAAGHRLLRENMRWIRAFVISSPLMDMLSAVVIILVLLYAHGEIVRHAMTQGTFVVFVYSLFKAYEPIKGLGTVYQQFEQAHGATAQVFEFLALQEEIDERPGALVLPPFSREVEFDNVTFAYESGMPVLRNIKLRAKAGEVVAIVGSSGAGKTTLVNLLPRFHDVTEGVLRVDGIDVREATLRSLREQMAIVTQETILFNDTVWNNICYGQANLPEERVIAAARAALAHDFIESLPQGYQTMLGERGTRLSGGQRQRLAIARALLKDSPILILDEATSELDSESEMLVQKALANLMVERTVFVIAHRLSTVRKADRIAVIEDGGIAELGTHQELLANGGTYARLCELQFSDADSAPSTASPMES